MDRLLGLLKIFAKEYGNWNKWSSWKCHENSLRPRSTPRSYIAGQGCDFKANLILKWKNDVSAARWLKRLPRPWSLNPQPTTICNLQDSPEQRTTATRACPPRGMSSRSSQRSYLVDKTLAELDFVQALTMLSKETNSPPPCPERSWSWIEVVLSEQSEESEQVVPALTSPALPTCNSGCSDLTGPWQVPWATSIVVFAESIDLVQTS